MIVRKRFGWDPEKAAYNLREHKVSFEEAKEVFADQHALLTLDVDHDEEEERWLIIGQSRKMRTLFVVFCERIHGDNGVTYRLISARKADRDEIQEYHDGY
jgi:uncharacterized protein